jgi:TM2 domain-containing membrane protein YozV
MRYLILILFVLSSVSSIAKGWVENEKILVEPITDSAQIFKPKHPRATAAILTITLGMLGAHRLYLGCKPWVPIFYVLSVGGVFFILPLLDLVAIISNKDISKFYDNNKILMWLK